MTDYHLNRKSVWFVLLMFGIVLLSGCSVFAPIKSNKVVDGQAVYLSPELQWILPEVNTLPGEFEVTQSVQANYGGKAYDLIFQVEKKTGQLAIVAMTPNAQPLLQMTYQNGKIDSSVSPLVGRKLPAEYLISDFMLAFGDEKIIASLLKSSGGSVISSGNRRIIQSGEDTVITIEYQGQANPQWPEVVTLDNHALGYQLAIQTINITAPDQKPL